jgi:K+-transporting ATPase KdpF subunit
MNVLYLIAGMVAAALLAYLFLCLLRPDLFD